MAEETLKYNIEINQEDLAAQLEQVRNQIDLSLGATAFAQDAPPSASSVVQLPQSGIFAAPDVSQQGMMDNMMAQLDQASQFTQLGFTKFQEDARRIGLLADTSLPSYQQNVDVYGQSPTGFFQSALGTFLPGAAGFDYDRSGMTRPEFRDISIKNLSNSLDPMQNDLMFTALGGTLGALGGALGPAGAFGGAITGVAIGGGLDLVNQVAGVRIRERESLEQGFKQIALQNFGPISSGDAQRMAEGLQDKAYSFEGRALNYDIDTMQENLVGFANSGGFRNVTSAQEMEDVMEGVVENARQFANNFKMKQQEAVQVMAQLSQNMIVDPSEMGDFSSRINAFSSYTGLNPTDAVAFGMQGMQMTRGMGFEAETSFNMALEARMQAERLRRADPETRQLINDLGGPDNFALSQVENSVRYMSSGAGLLSAAGVLGGTGFGSTSDVLSSAGAFLSGDPRNIFRLQTELPEVMGALGLEGMQGLQVQNAYNLARDMGFTDRGGTIDESAMVGIMSQMLGISTQQSRGLIETAREASSRDFVGGVYTDRVTELNSQARENSMGITGNVRGLFGEYVANPFMETFMNPIGEGLDAFGNYVEEGFENFSDRINDRTRIRFDSLTGAQRLFLDRDNLSEQAQGRRERILEGTRRRSSSATIEDFESAFSEGQLRDIDRTADRGIGRDNLFRMVGGLSESNMLDFYEDFIEGTEYSVEDLYYFRYNTEARNGRYLSQHENTLEQAGIENIKPGDYEEFYSRTAAAFGADYFTDLDADQRRTALDYFNYMSRGGTLSREQERIGQTMLRSDSLKKAGLEDYADPERLAEQAAGLRSKIESNVPTETTTSFTRSGTLLRTETPVDVPLDSYINEAARYQELKDRGEMELGVIGYAESRGIQSPRMFKQFFDTSAGLAVEYSQIKTEEFNSRVTNAAQTAITPYGSKVGPEQATLMKEFVNMAIKSGMAGSGQDLLIQDLMGLDDVSIDPSKLSRAEAQQDMFNRMFTGVDKIIAEKGLDSESWRGADPAFKQLYMNSQGRGEQATFEAMTALKNVIRDGALITQDKDDL